MKKLMVVFAILIASVSPGSALTRIDAATRQDVEDLMQPAGVRDRMPLLLSAMARQFAASCAARYQQQHPNANPAKVQKAATEAAERLQQRLKAIAGEELRDVMIDAMQAAQADINKHVPEIEAQIETTAAAASQPGLTQPK